jgi:hypothetical protein
LQILYTAGYCTIFLFTHLEEYGDKIADILKCIDYVMHPDKGNIVIGIVDSEIVGSNIEQHRNERLYS